MIKAKINTILTLSIGLITLISGQAFDENQNQEPTLSFQKQHLNIIPPSFQDKGSQNNDNINYQPNVHEEINVDIDASKEEQFTVSEKQQQVPVLADEPKNINQDRHKLSFPKFATDRGFADKTKMDFVREMARKAYSAYDTYAYGCDELNPVSNTCHNWYGGQTILNTPVDSLDTLYIMNLTDLYNKAKTLVLEKLDLRVNSSVNVFEAEIRVLGGLLSAYELDGDDKFLQKAKEVGNILFKSFFTETGLPVTFMSTIRGDLKSWSSTSLACLGTNQLEFQYLSDVTGDRKYAEKSLKVYDIIREKADEFNGTYLQGLYHKFHSVGESRVHEASHYRASNITYDADNDWQENSSVKESDGVYVFKDTANQNDLESKISNNGSPSVSEENEVTQIPSTNAEYKAAPSDDSRKSNTYHEFGIGAETDSFYEYLLKITVVDPKSKKWKSRSDEAWASIMKNNVVQKFDYAYAPDFFANTMGSVNHRSEFHHLSCFAGGTLALRAFLDKTGNWHEYLDLGQKLTWGCYEPYKNSPTGLAGELMKPENGNYIAIQSQYFLRPELVESVFYMWRITHDPIYREMAWNVTLAIEKYCFTGTGYSGLRNVLDPNSKDDNQPSFFLAETLKYLYLTFTDDDVIPLEEYVFNTEAHPLSRYGSGKRKNQLRKKTDK